MTKGDIVLVPFPFTDLTGSKLRPALVLAVNMNDIIVAFVSSQLSLKSEYNVRISPNNYNGLKTTSVIKVSKIATLEKKIIQGKLGYLEYQTIIEVNKKLYKFLKL